MLFEELLDYGLVKAAEPAVTTEPVEEPVLPQLHRAKQHSDNRRYREKAEILRRLMIARPKDWVVDQPGPHHPGITHQPTRFRFHAPRKIIPQEVKSASNTMKAVRATPLQSPLAYLQALRNNFKKFQNSDAYVRRMQMANSPAAQLGHAAAVLGGKTNTAPIDQFVEKFSLDMNALPTATATNDWTTLLPATEVATATAGLAAGGGAHWASGIVGSVNPNSRKAMTDFMANVSPTAPARSFLNNYVHHGSRVLGNVILDGTGGNPSHNGMDVMGAVYGKGWHPAAQTALEYLNGKWDWKKDHYKQFASGALPAYMKITQEVFDDPGNKQWPQERVNNTLSELAKALVVSKDRTELAKRLAASGFDAEDGTLTNALKPMALGGNYDTTYAKLRQAIGIPATVDGAKSFDPVELMTNKLVNTVRTLAKQDSEFVGLDKIIRRTPVGGESRVSPAIAQMYQRLSPAGQQRLLRTMVDDQDLLPSLVASRFKQYWKDAPSLYRSLMGNSMRAVDTIGSVRRMSGLLPSSLGLLAHGATSLLGSKPKIQLVAPGTQSSVK